MEQVLEKYARGYAVIDLDALHYNLEHMKANIAKDTKIVGVIKANGYGHGALRLAKEMEAIDYIWGYAVATYEEADELRNGDINKPILILGYTFPYCYASMIEQNVRVTVFRKDMLDELSRIAVGLGKKAFVHIKVDTGMSRIGVFPNEAGEELIAYALSLPGIEVEGIFTHFARADEIDKQYVEKQIKIFSDFVAATEQHLNFTFPIVHCSNSAGIIELPEANKHMVRAGITLYGLWPSNEVRKDLVDLKPLMSLKSHIVYIKEIQPGTAISYGGTYVADQTRTVATIPLGYGDGYPRGLSGKGYVLIHGKKAPILGRVCMDQFMVDVSEIPEAKMGDLVTLLGQDEGACITMEELGDISGRFNYEFACDLGTRIPRVYTGGLTVEE